MECNYINSPSLTSAGVLVLLVLGRHFAQLLGRHFPLADAVLRLPRLVTVQLVVELRLGPARVE